MNVELVELFKLAGKLKKVERTGWVTRVQIENPESVAEHSFRAAFIGMIMGERKGLDSNRLMKMLLIHDLGESIIGDFDLYAKKKLGMDYWNQKEKKAIHDILFENLSQEAAQEYYDLWMEFDAKETELAKFARQIDKFELILQAAAYEREGYPKEKFKVFWEHAEGALAVTDPDLKEMLDIARKELT
ncbi:MAG: HD domain-containing protein [Candidatus Aenigmarchaeota archaeon]|nr:HD domain-containing protein [Candidatus Aenigmarchaeota archaeon]